MNDPIKFTKGQYVGNTLNECSGNNILTSETAFHEGYTSDWHYHENPHFSHILTGGSQEIGPGYSERQYAGKGLYYFPGNAHQNISYSPNTRIFNIEIENEFFKEHEVNMPPESLMFDNQIPLNSIGLLRILKEHQWNDQDSRIAIEQLCVNMIDQSSIPVKNYPEWTTKIRGVLYDHWNKSLSLVDFATCVNIHPVTLSKYFSKYFKFTLGEYFRKVKIEHAIELIRLNKSTLTDIAYECGFSDQAHFTRTFYRQTGMLPKHYKSI